MAAKYKVGEHVASHNSGLVYIIKTVRELDLTGETFAYTVRRLRGGIEYGPTRTISECGLCPEFDPPGQALTRHLAEMEARLDP